MKSSVFAAIESAIVTFPKAFPSLNTSLPPLPWIVIAPVYPVRSWRSKVSAPDAPLRWIVPA